MKIAIRIDEIPTIPLSIWEIYEIVQAVKLNSMHLTTLQSLVLNDAL